jgi:hypothetical protein
VSRVGDEDVLGLDVAVNNSSRVRVAEGVGDLVCHTQCVIYAQTLLAIEPMPLCLALDERHHVAKQAIRCAAVVNGDDVRML